MSDGVHSPADAPCERVKVQFDYAWKWFNYHADQRTKMFNYMLIAMGIFATATVNALDRNLPYVVVVLCALSTVFALSFSRLDRRNEELVQLGEEVLAHLERTGIFGANTRIMDRGGNEIDFGILWRQELIERGIDQSAFRSALRGKHRFWLRSLAYLIAAVFATGGLWVGTHLDDYSAKPAQTACHWAVACG